MSSHRTDPAFYLTIWFDADGVHTQEFFGNPNKLAEKVARFSKGLESDSSVSGYSIYRRELKWVRPESGRTADRQ